MRYRAADRILFEVEVAAMTNELSASEGRRRAIRAGLVVLAVGQGLAALWALASPRGFYEGFPGFGHHWVSALPPYNEHLVTDYGGGFLALSVLAGLAAILMERRLVQVTAICWLVASVPHFIFHLTTLASYGTADALGNVISLAGFVVIPAAILVALRGGRSPAPATTRAAP
jgi:hypothetical protein